MADEKGKKRRLTGGIVAGVLFVSLVATGFALAQGTGAFDPASYLGANSSSMAGGNPYAFQTQSSDTDAAANREKDDLDDTDNDISADELIQDSSSGTTALQVSSSGKATVSGSNGESGSSGSNTHGVVINGDGNGNGGSDDTGGTGAQDSSGDQGGDQGGGSQTDPEPDPGPQYVTYTLHVEMLNTDGSYYIETLSTSTATGSATFSLSSLAATMAKRGWIEDQLFSGWHTEDGTQVGSKYTTSQKETTLYITTSGRDDYDADKGYSGDGSIYVLTDENSYLDFTLIRNNPNIKAVYISAGVKNIRFSIGYGTYTGLEEYIVDPENTSFMTVDGVLYTYDGTKLISCPAAKTSIAEWSPTVNEFGTASFYSSQVVSLDIPEGVTTIDDDWNDLAAFKSIVAPSTLGSVPAYFTPEETSYVEIPSTLSIDGYAFARGESTTFRTIRITGTTGPTKLSSNSLKLSRVTTDVDSLDTIIMVEDAVFEDYLIEWGYALDQLYGPGAALKILASPGNLQTDWTYNEETGVYEQTSSGGANNFWTWNNGLYRCIDGKNTLVGVLSASCTRFDVQDGTVAIASGVLDGVQETLRAIYLPASITSLDEDYFAPFTKLRAIVSYASEPFVESLGASTEAALFVKPSAASAFASLKEQVRRIVSVASEYCGAESGSTSLDPAVIYMENSSGGYTMLDVPTDITKLTAISGTSVIAAQAAVNRTLLTSVSIPSSSDLSSGLTSIGESAFEGCTSLVQFGSISVASGTFNLNGSMENLASIGKRAFYGCPVKVVYLGAALENAGAEAFGGGSALTTVYDLSGIALASAFNGNGSPRLYANASSIVAGAYAGWTSLAAVQFYYSNTNLTAIPDDCFNGCTGLKTVSYTSPAKTSTLVSIGARAFYGCTALTTPALYGSYTNTTYYWGSGGKYYAFNKLTSIGEKAFYGCTALAKVAVPNKVASLGESAFANCTALTNLYLASAGSLAALPKSMCEGDTSLTSWTIPYYSGMSALESIGSRAFYGCSALATCPHIETYTSRFTSFKRIEAEAFAESGLTTLTLPESVSNLGEKCFAGAPLATLTINSSTAPSMGSFVFGSSPTSSLSIAVPSDNAKAAFYEAWEGSLRADYDDDVVAKWLGYTPEEEQTEATQSNSTLSIAQDEASHDSPASTSEDADESEEAASSGEGDDDDADAEGDGSSDDDGDDSSSSDDGSGDPEKDATANDDDEEDADDTKDSNDDSKNKDAAKGNDASPQDAKGDESAEPQTSSATEDEA